MDFFEKYVKKENPYASLAELEEVNITISR